MKTFFRKKCFSFFMHFFLIFFRRQNVNTLGSFKELFSGPESSVVYCNLWKNLYFWVVIKATSVLLKSSITHEGSIVLVGKSYQSVTETLLNKKPCGGFAIGSSIEEILHIEFHMAKSRFVLCVSFLPPFHFCRNNVGLHFTFWWEPSPTNSVSMMSSKPWIQSSWW